MLTEFSSIRPTQTSTGGEAILNPGVAYVQTTGNDSTAELGNPAKPFQLVSAALTAATNAGQSSPSLRFGRGTFNAGEILTAPFSSIFLAGEGSDYQTFLEASWNGDSRPNAPTATPGENGEGYLGGVELRSDHSLFLTINIQAGNGGSGGNAAGDDDSGSEGGNGGSVAGFTLINVTGSVTIYPGEAGSGGSPSGLGNPGIPGNDGEVFGSFARFCNLSVGGATVMIPKLSIINNVSVIDN